nr:phospholipase D family protein [Burkholderia cepacia]
MLMPAARVSACGLSTGFSPEGSAEQQVIATLGNATHTIRMMAYALTSPPIVRQLLAAKRRGVDVAVVADRKGNVGRANIAALNLLVQAGIPTRLIDRYAIAHDKVIVVDGTTVETGSFNYSAAAARRNSENVVVMSACPAIARQYLAHWQSRWDQGTAYQLPY